MSLLREIMALLPPDKAGTALPGLIASVQALVDTCLGESGEAQPLAPVRVMNHFACTGGTLVSRMLAAQPGCLLLSEVDPFSPMAPPASKLKFTPTDLILLARSTTDGVDDDTVAAMFMASVTALRDRLAAQDRTLILRLHDHYHYCSGTAVATRPPLLSRLAQGFDLRALVLVRHPLDSFASLTRNEWLHFEPKTLEEYARRYLVFLDDHDGTRLFHYETFVHNPSETACSMADHLDLRFDADWQQRIPGIRMTGDSGRKGDAIAPRKRLPMSEELVLQAGSSLAYGQLCARLGYDVDPAGDSLPVSVQA